MICPRWVTTILFLTGSIGGGVWVGIVLRQIELHRVRLDGDRDDEHDQEHQHHVDQRRGVDVHHRFAFGTAR
jgi:hypothetical protein